MSTIKFSADPEWEQLRQQLQGIALNKNYLSNVVSGAISKWVFGLKGPWQMIVATILLEAINQCSEPDRQAKQIISAALSRDSEIVPNIPSIKSKRLPPNIEALGAKMLPKSISANASGSDAAVDPKLLVIPFDQTVSIRWNAIGHAALCSEYISRVEIFSNKDGAIFRPFVQEAHGISRFPNSESVTNQGTTQISLTAGGYIVRAISVGKYSSASITVDYKDVSIPPGILKPKWVDYAILGSGVALCAAGIYYIAS